MSKFYNISTDTTLGGNAPSDTTVASQKALKTYIDAQVSSGNYHPGLLSYEWDDHIRYDIQWLRSDTFSWQNGGVYEAAINHLKADLNSGTTLYAWKPLNGTTKYYTTTTLPVQGDPYYDADGIERGDMEGSSAPSYIIIGSTYFWRDSADDISHLVAQTKTISGTTISYYEATDGHKICLPSQESNLSTIYDTTGYAWFYILDETNNRFKLPRSRFQVNAGNLVKTIDYANKVSISFPYTAPGDGYIGASLKYVDQTVGSISVNNVVIFNNSTKYNGSYLIGFESVSIYVKKGDVVSISGFSNDTSYFVPYNSTDSEQYLYFYMGEFTQSAIENTAGLNSELFNSKADTGHEVVEFQAPNASNNYVWYRKYKDGWVEQGGIISESESGNYVVNLPVEMANVYYSIQLTCKQDSNGALAYYMDKTTTTFTREATNRSGTTAGRETIWKVEGMRYM